MSTAMETKQPSRTVTSAFKSYLDEIYPGIRVQVRTVGPSSARTWSLRWLDGPTETTMEKLVDRFIHDNNVALSSWAKMDRKLSARAEDSFASFFRAQTGLRYQYDEDYPLTYNAHLNKLETPGEDTRYDMRSGYNLAHEWAARTELPI